MELACRQVSPDARNTQMRSASFPDLAPRYDKNMSTLFAANRMNDSRFSGISPS
jgi:hypothetical protein